VRGSDSGVNLQLAGSVDVVGSCTDAAGPTGL